MGGAVRYDGGRLVALSHAAAVGAVCALITHPTNPQDAQPCLVRRAHRWVAMSRA